MRSADPPSFADPNVRQHDAPADRPDRGKRRQHQQQQQQLRQVDAGQSSVWAVIPVAGRASRMAPIHRGGPKALLRIGTGTILDRLVAHLEGSVTDICLVVDKTDGLIPRTLGSMCRGIRLHYVLQPEPLGVGDAVLRSVGRVSGTFVTVMGDVFYDRNLDDHVNAWRRSGAEGAVLVEPIERPPREPIGLVETNEGFVTSLEKGREDWKHRLGLAGLAILPETAFEAAGEIRPASSGEIELESVIEWLMTRREMRFVALPYEGWRRNINTEADLVAAHARIGTSFA